MLQHDDLFVGANCSFNKAVLQIHKQAAEITKNRKVLHISVNGTRSKRSSLCLFLVFCLLVFVLLSCSGLSCVEHHMNFNSSSV